MSKIKIAIVGAAGYSGEELVRLLLKHPNCEVKVITSRQYDKQHISEVFPRFAEEDIYFSKPNVDAIIAECDVAFLALPHGLAAEFAEPLVKGGVKVIDISADFRLRSLDKYKEYYGVDHPAPELLKNAVYGLPEHYRKDIEKANLIASPGCYPTSIMLPTIPLLKSGIVDSDGIIVASASGVSGAGRKVDLPFIYPECNESFRAYAPTGHRHLPEIEQELAKAAGLDDLAINFVPHLSPVNRGINSTIFLNAKGDCSQDKVLDILNKEYANCPFVRILPKGKLADTKHITMTNMCEIGVAFDERTNKVIITSCIDNLTKGASGQAIQSMNIMYDFAENAGL